MSESVRHILCPYCGHVQRGGERCERCRGVYEKLSRRATQVAMGPWFIRDESNPFRPGCSYEVLRRQIEAGRVKADTIIRGPTTRQFWALARSVRGVSHLLGYCHKCRRAVPRGAERCPACGVAFEAVPQRNELGLQFPTEATAAAAQEIIQRALAEQAAGVAARREAAAVPAGAAGDDADDVFESQVAGVAEAAGGGASAPGADLLEEVLRAAPAAATPAEADEEPIPALLAPEALDFAPGPGAAEPRSALQGPRRRGVLLTAALVVLVLIILAAQIWFARALLSGSANPPAPAGDASPADAGPISVHKPG